MRRFSGQKRLQTAAPTTVMFPPIAVQMERGLFL